MSNDTLDALIYAFQSFNWSKTMSENMNTASLIDGIKNNIQTQVLTLPPVPGVSDKEVTVIVKSNGAAGMKIESIKPFLEEYRTKPARIIGMSQHSEVESFIAHMNQFKAEQSVYFADRGNLSLLAFYDYHQKDKPDNLGHRAKFAPKKSRQLTVWSTKDKETMSQADFAHFIENNILDLCDVPPAGGVGTTTYTDIAKQLNTTIASPNKILELARGLSIHEASTAKSHINITTGEVTLEYTTSHADGTGKKLALPGLFLIAVPVFENGALYRVLVRLRYRLQDGKVRWWYELYQLDASIDDAFNEVVAKVSKETSVTLYRGIAEG